MRLYLPNVEPISSITSAGAWKGSSESPIRAPAQRLTGAALHHTEQNSFKVDLLGNQRQKHEKERKE
ncbi:hypothetical protein E2C01_071987 [Portunus trituberculatus]|uniref:Uncharacterized protein n=1 Tax=Portunus trituberculatus TaxID=210409 RepID=A0A5B7HYI1_PORTR|nr:hypothetical protein [Portunus trituberculatus]